MPVLHLNGHFRPEFATSNGALRFLWILYALGTTGALIVILALKELLGRRRSPSP
jgi:hypothetical protein